MFVRILSLIRLARVSRLVRFFNEVEKVSSNSMQSSKFTFEIQSTFLLSTDTLPDLAPMTNLTLNTYNVIRKTRADTLFHDKQSILYYFPVLNRILFFPSAHTHTLGSNITGLEKDKGIEHHRCPC